MHLKRLFALVLAGAAFILLVALALTSRLEPAPTLKVAVSTLILDRDRQLLSAVPVADGRWRLPVALDDVDPLLIDLLLLWEDRRFFFHHGVDWAALGRALTQLLAHQRILSGGSTLSMQLARLLDPAPTRSATGKWRQIARALAIERNATKTEILQAYLQLAGYGGNLEGVRSASLAWFGKEPRRLTPAEAALLVALPQSPERRRPDRFAEAARTARNRVLARAEARGLIDHETALHAMSTPVPHLRRALPRLAAHRAHHWTRRLPNAPVVQLTLSARLQRELETLAQDRASLLPAPVSMAILVADHRRGEILAAVGSPGYTDTTRDGFIDMTEAVRSPGSTLKPLIFGLAFERGLAHPESLIDDRPSGFGHYAPSNFDGAFSGTLSLRAALQQSLNVPAVILLERIGPAALLARLGRAGATPRLPGTQPPGLAIALGGLGLSPRDLLALYASIARGGTPVALRELLAPSLPEADRRANTQVLDPRAAWYLTSILSDADAMNTGANAIALKTGTSYGYRDAWAIGFDGRHTVAVWVGRPDAAAVAELTGAGSAVPVLIDTFARLGPPTPFPPAPEGSLQLSSDQLPPPLRHVGRSATTPRAAPSVEIAYPPDGARIDLGSAWSDAALSPLILKARGGHPPLRWIINGQPLGVDAFARTAQWQPDGRGFTEILLLDALGASATARIFID